MSEDKVAGGLVPPVLMLSLEKSRVMSQLNSLGCRSVPQEKWTRFTLVFPVMAGRSRGNRAIVLLLSLCRILS